MAQTDRKVKLEALSKQLHDQRGGYEVKALLELVQLRMDGVKNQMLTCKPEEFLRLQGEAQAYDKIARDIIRPSPTLRNTEEK